MVRFNQSIRIIAEFIKSGNIKPVIDRVFPFKDVQSAMEYAQSGRAKGRSLITYNLKLQIVRVNNRVKQKENPMKGILLFYYSSLSFTIPIS